MEIIAVNQMSNSEIVAYLKDFQDSTFKRIEELEQEVDKLKKENDKLKQNEEDLKLEIQVLKEKNKLLIAAKYQSQKNKVVLKEPTLFDDVEEEVLKTEESELEVITIAEHKRVRRPKEKHIDYSDLERRYEETLPIPEGEDICPKCGSKMEIKRYEEKEELVVIPQEVYVRVTRIPVLECKKCQENNEEGKSTCRTVSHPNFLLPRSLVSPELLAYIIDMKYVSGLPLYAIEEMFKRIGINIPRRNMCNWIIGVNKYLEPIFNMMKKDLMNSPVILADETTTQVLKEEGKLATSTSYMWVYRVPKKQGNIVLYDYQASRSGENPKEFLKGYNGYLETDKYKGYEKVENITRCLCNMHGLKNFKDAFKLLPNNKERVKSDEAEAIRKYQAIFSIEDEIQEKAKEISENNEKRYEYIQKNRESRIKPKFKEFFEWLREIEIRNSGSYAMSKAISYLLTDEEGFTRFIENGHIPISNQACEQSIRPFVVSRNRCKFYVSTNGAHVSALIYSIVITCKECEINPYMYFMHLFEKMPNINLEDEMEIAKLLPYSDSLPTYTKKMSNKEMKAILSKEKKQ